MEEETLLQNKKALEEFLMDIDILNEVESVISDFNAFETLGIIHTEIRHSNILGWLLSPTENHGLDEYLIKKIVESVIYSNYNELTEVNFNPFNISLMDYHDFIIRREWKNIDIIAVSESNKFLIAIENKVWSNESKHQLKKYYDIIQEEYKHYKKVFIYLTPYGDLSSKPNVWLNLDYSTVSNIIEKGLTIKKDLMSERTKSFINQYLEVVRRYIVGDNELENVCREIYFKHRRALDLIFEYKPDIYTDISQHLQKMVKEHPDLILDDSNKIYVRFTSKRLDDLLLKEGKGWVSSGRIILFEFQGRADRLSLKLLIGPGNNELRNQYFELARNQKQIFKGIRKNNSIKFTQIYSKEILVKHFSEDFEYEEILSKVTTRFNKFLETELKLLEDVFIENLSDYNNTSDLSD